jgi:homoserine kinase
MMVAAATAPASSGNLGPGFDALALALELRCRCEAEPADEWWIEEQGRRYRPQHGDLVVRAAVAAVGERPMRLVIDNAIPRSRGLGSSSAVATAAAAAALRACGDTPVDRRLFEIVTELEGHPDNAAAAVYGGLVAARDGVVRRLPMSSELVVVVGIPDTRLSTHKARAALPGAVRHAAAARNIARVVMLLDGLRTGDAAALGAADGDEMHEAPRHDLSPITHELMDAATDAGAMHAAWSGAGPSAIAFATAATQVAVSEAMAERLGGMGEVAVLAVAESGWW